jgi:hypothetical protein
MTHEDIRAIVQEEILKFFATLGSTAGESSKSDQWVPLRDAVKPLGYPSYQALHKDVRAGVFRMGKEIRDRRKPGAKTARLQINIQRAQKRLLEDPANRRVV